MLDDDVQLFMSSGFPSNPAHFLPGMLFIASASINPIMRWNFAFIWSLTKQRGLLFSATNGLTLLKEEMLAVSRGRSARTHWDDVG